MAWPLRSLGSLHGLVVHSRGVRGLAVPFAEMIPGGHSVPDVGCVDGLIDRLILDRRTDLRICGADPLIRRDRPRRAIRWAAASVHGSIVGHGALLRYSASHGTTGGATPGGRPGRQALHPDQGSQRRGLAGTTTSLHGCRGQLSPRPELTHFRQFPNETLGIAET
jgi:hypothetical protein